MEPSAAAAGGAEEAAAGGEVSPAGGAEQSAPPQQDVTVTGELAAHGGLKKGVNPFDRCDVPARCRELLRRISQMTGASSGSPPWKWDILELLEDSREALRDVRQANSTADRGTWQEISEVIDSEQDASTLPMGLRKTCEELLSRREMWLGDFDAELRAILARGRELRERLLFEDVDRAGWFSAAGVSPIEVQRLLERHLDMHQRGARLARQLQTLGRALRQQGAVSSRRRAFQARTMGEKLQSSLVCLAAVAVAPVPGSSEMWLATTTMMWLEQDKAWQHVVYEHPRDAATETILNQFQCYSTKAREALAQWSAMPPAKRRNCVLIHNASVRRVILKTHLVNCIDGRGDSSADWTSALDAHPLGSVMKKALTSLASDQEDKVVIAAQRLAVVQLPPKPDANWSWRGLFSYGDTKVGECSLREGGVFSFICVDCGLRVGDRGEESRGCDESGAMEAPAAGKEPEGGAATAGAPLDPEGPQTAVEVVNRMDETVQVKVFAPGGGGHAAMLFKRALAEGAISPGVSRLFSLKASKEGRETDFDVEIRIGHRKAKCEVVGGQAIFVDCISTDA